MLSAQGRIGNLQPCVISVSGYRQYEHSTFEAKPHLERFFRWK